jgi:hypothetical protein
MGRYLELAKKTLEVLAQPQEAPRQAKPDFYADRMDAALRQIDLPEYPAGMIPWLDTAHPALYLELTSLIPDQVHRLWNEGGPLNEFEATLDRLVAVHREACRLYRAEQAIRKTEIIGIGRLPAPRGAE